MTVHPYFHTNQKTTAKNRPESTKKDLKRLNRTFLSLKLVEPKQRTRWRTNRQKLKRKTALSVRVRSNTRGKLKQLHSARNRLSRQQPGSCRKMTTKLSKLCGPVCVLAFCTKIVNKLRVSCFTAIS